MTEPDPIVRALHVLVDELRSEPVRELRWDRIDPTARALPALEPARRRPLWPVGALALAAGIALVFLAQPGGPKPSASTDRAADTALDLATLPRTPGDGDAFDPAALHEGDLVEAGLAGLTFARAGSVRWTLAPSSRARIRAVGRDGVGQVVALEAGSLRADVTPRPTSEGLVEAFAVEVAGTRVAVHGTSFRVTRRDGDVLVAVEHGTVAVGPVGHVGATTGRLLVAPMRAAFSLDGGRSAHFVDADEPALLSATTSSTAAAPQLLVEPRPPQRDPSLAPSAMIEAPHTHAQPSKPAVETTHLTETVVRATLARCFDEAFAKRSSQVKLTVSSSLRLTLRADGSIVAARFDPPLEPALQGCAERMMTGAFSPGERVMEFAVSFER
jgi:hypothetical protein